MSNVVCIVQARLGSSRLPRKIMSNLTKNKTMLEHIIERLKTSSEIDELIIATTDTKQDDEIAEFCLDRKINIFRGSEENVLERYYLAANKYEADIIVRITSDCPLIHIPLVDNVIRFFKEKNVDYVAPRSIEGLIRGLDVEVFSYKALKKAYLNCKDKIGIEHVTHYIYSNVNIFNVLSYKCEENLKGFDMRLCVDEDLDLKKIRVIYEKFYNGNIINVLDVIKWLKENKDINNINKNIKQKNLEE